MLPPRAARAAALRQTTSVGARLHREGPLPAVRFLESLGARVFEHPTTMIASSG
jgi:hypothetical protein